MPSSSSLCYDIAVATPTHGRSCILNLGRWLNAQSLRPSAWCVAGSTDHVVGPFCDFIERRADDWDLPENAAAAIEAARDKCEVVAYLEDDDYIGPQYLQRLQRVMWREGVDGVFVVPERYYNVQFRRARLNPWRRRWESKAVGSMIGLLRGPAIKCALEACREAIPVKGQERCTAVCRIFGAKMKSGRFRFKCVPGGASFIQLKGVQGGGATAMHHQESRFPVADDQGEMFTEWTGERVRDVL